VDSNIQARKGKGEDALRREKFKIKALALAYLSPFKLSLFEGATERLSDESHTRIRL
jgi:hypothetical protein